MFRYIIRLYQRFAVVNKPFLGRWNYTYDEKMLARKIDLANKDNSV